MKSRFKRVLGPLVRKVKRLHKIDLLAVLEAPIKLRSDEGSCRVPAFEAVHLQQASKSLVEKSIASIKFGDPLDLEVVAELLTTQAIHVKAGAQVRIDGWGGAPVSGRVTRVDPAGFVKVSALGIEEQRVRTIIDLVDPPSALSELGHDFRVVVHVAASNSKTAMRVPVGSLFRKGNDWAVFAVKDGRARATIVKVGQRNNRQAEVLAALASGDKVVLHPSDRVKDGSRVAQRVSD